MNSKEWFEACKESMDLLKDLKFDDRLECLVSAQMTVGVLYKHTRDLAIMFGKAEIVTEIEKEQFLTYAKLLRQFAESLIKLDEAISKKVPKLPEEPQSQFQISAPDARLVS